MTLPSRCAARAKIALLAVAALAGMHPAALHAQQLSLPDALPDAPLAPSGFEPPQQAARRVSLDGTLQAGPGDVLPGATVTVTDAAGNQSQVTSNQQGAFHFEGLAPGPATLTVRADTFASKTLALILPTTPLTVTVTPAVVTADVQVTADQDEIGAAQIQAETKQRVLGLFPNYYVVYAGNVVPMKPQQKFKVAAHFAFDPVSIALNGVAAGVEQATNTYPGYGQGATGYFKRFGASLADSVDSTFLSGAVFPVLFHQDPRYFFKGTGSTLSRVLYAAEFVVRTRDDHGRWRPNYSLILGNLTSGAISNAYYPAGDRHGVGLTFENAFIGTAFGAAGNILEELFLKHLTPNLPNYNSNGSPTPEPAP